MGSDVSPNGPNDLFVFPASYGQQRLWFLHQLEHDSAPYNIPVAYRLRGHLDLEALERSLEEIVQRHEAFRTTFSSEDGQTVQVIASELKMELQVIDLPPQSTGDAELRRRLAEEAERPFNLETGPLFRATLLRRGDTDHVLQVTMHHSVSDAWSMGLFSRELGALYGAFLAGEASPLPELPIQYADFAVWQREWLQGEVVEEQLSYWREQLANLAPLELPTDRLRPAVQSFRGAGYPFRLEPALVQGLRALGSRQGATLHMTMAAAFLALLHRYTGQDDVSLGIPVAGRNRAEVEGLVGFFVNTLVLRGDASENPTFHELLARTRDAAVGAFAHQDLPFEKLVEELQPERDLSRNPLFQVMFAFQNATEGDLALAGLEVERLPIRRGTSQFDLSLSLTETTDSEEGGVIEGEWEYATDLFDPATIERMQRHFETLLEAVVQDPSRRISELELLNDAERHQLLVEWNDTAVSYPEDQCLHQLFEAQVKRTPDAAALVYEDRSLTYSELNARANQLAHHLRGRGIGPEVLVGICVERSLDMVVGLLGILKAGGAYVPLDPAYPPERLAFMLADAGAPVLLTQQHLLDRLPAMEADLVCLDRDWPQIDGERTDSPEVDIGSDNLAYMIYTSGSTGKPKGALNSHKGICNRLLWMQEEYRIDSDDAILQKTPFSFDVSVWEFFWPLMTGARLVMAVPGGHQDPSYLVGTVKDRGITVMHFVPSMMQLFLEEPRVGECDSLRHVICSGEALPNHLEERFFSRLKARLHNLYGPTEAAVDVTFWACRRQSERRTVPIGRPVANTQIYILDESLGPVPIGVAGELHIGGKQVGRGYHNRPELTAERFIPDPFSADRTARLYKTGDLCRWLPNGTIEYLGRNDFQVKIRGFRIELGEIEARLLTCPGVREAAVVAREDRPGDQRLVAYVVTPPDSDLDVSDLRKELASVLPEYMVPAAILTLPAFPLTPNGKLDRRALPTPEWTELSNRSFEPPKSNLEVTIASVWREALSVDQVGTRDNFFDLGGHSLLVARVQRALVEKLGRELSMVDLFRYPTVESLARYLGDGGEGPDSFKSLEERRERARRKRAAPRRRRSEGDGEERN